LDTDRDTIRMMADYDSYPIWRLEHGGTVNVDPATLPISSELAESLLRWAEDYDRTLNRGDPVSSGFSDPAAENEFYARGEMLARRLAGELGDTRQVTYFDVRSGTDVVIAP
jgi:hypothetical protein